VADAGVTTTSCPGRPTLPVGKIVAVGRNYSDHVREMGGAAADPPVLFLKPPSALVPGGGAIALPSFSREVHHEVELVVRVGRGGARLAPAAAARAVDACAVGIDLTARDLQAEAKKRGEPWAVAKGFDGSAPVSAFVALDDVGALATWEIALAIGGATKQRGAIAQMTLAIPELVAFVSSRFRLEAGDLIFTGTPAGVGPVRAGDVVVATLAPSGAKSPTARLEVRFTPPDEGAGEGPRAA
jgi:2-keto-4-pentenoate hydratase/2-oxohepta-3-ene-1,7-dioic acid hydratase in catechol pathway